MAIVWGVPMPKSFNDMGYRPSIVGKLVPLDESQHISIHG